MAMKSLRFYFVVIILLGFFSPGISQQLVFEKKYTGITILPPCFVYKRALPRQISELADRSILIMGNSYSIDTTHVNASEAYHDLKKLDPEGNIIWTQYIRPDTILSNNVFIDLTSFQVLDNGDILLIGEKEGSTFGARTVHLILLDSDGTHLFDTTYVNGYTNYIYTVPEGSARCSNGYVVAGYTFVPFGIDEAYVLKLDQNYAKQWEFKLGQSYSTYSDFKKIIPRSDGSVDCFGNMRIPSTGKDVMMFVKLNSGGQMTMLKTYDDSQKYFRMMDAAAGNGFRVILGYYLDNHYRPLLIKTDDSGNVIWQQFYPGTSDVSILPYGIALNQQNEILVTGEKDYIDTITQFTAASDIYLMKTDMDGNKTWEAVYGTNYTNDSTEWAYWEFGQNIVCAADGSYLILGDDNINKSYGPVLSVLKIAEGQVGAGRDPQKNESLLISPNPVHDKALVMLPQESKISEGTFRLFDITGTPVMTISHINTDRFILSRYGQPDGIYIYSLEQGRKIIARGKIIVR